MAFDYITSFHQGGYWATKVAERLQCQGVACYAPPVEIARTSEERQHMTRHEKDIVFSWTHIPLEVKSSSREFNDDINHYPYDSLFVDTVSGYDNKAITPMAYVMVSQPLGGMVCVSPSSYDAWEKVHRFDRQREISDWFYSAPKNMLIPFNMLVEYLLIQQNEAKK